MEGPVSGWTAMVRAVAVFCFLRSCAEGSSADWYSLCRFGAIPRRISFRVLTAGCRPSPGGVRRGRREAQDIGKYCTDSGLD